MRIWREFCKTQNTSSVITVTTAHSQSLRLITLPSLAYSLFLEVVFLNRNYVKIISHNRLQKIVESLIVRKRILKLRDLP